MTNKKDNIRLLDDGAVVKEHDANIASALTEMQKFLKNLPLIIEGYAIEARMLKIKYDSLIAVKFTEKQAIELCKK